MCGVGSALRMVLPSDIVAPARHAESGPVMVCGLRVTEAPLSDSRLVQCRPVLGRFAAFPGLPPRK